MYCKVYEGLKNCIRSLEELRTSSLQFLDWDRKETVGSCKVLLHHAV